MEDQDSRVPALETFRVEQVVRTGGTEGEGGDKRVGDRVGISRLTPGFMSWDCSLQIHSYPQGPVLPSPNF